MISHRNVIANTLQISTFEKPYRESKMKAGDSYPPPEIVLGLLPQSHIYALVVICHTSTYRGDEVVNLPKFDFVQLLTAIQRFKITQLYLVRAVNYRMILITACTYFCAGPPNHYCNGEKQCSAEKVRPRLHRCCFHWCRTFRYRDCRGTAAAAP